MNTNKQDNEAQQKLSVLFVIEVLKRKVNISAYLKVYLIQILVLLKFHHHRQIPILNLSIFSVANVSAIIELIEYNGKVAFRKEQMVFNG